MTTSIELLTDAAAGATGKEITLAADDLFIKATATTWGGESVKLQEQASDNTWSDIPGASFTANSAQVYQGYRGQVVRVVTSGSGGAMAGVNVTAGQRYD